MHSHMFVHTEDKVKRIGEGVTWLIGVRTWTFKSSFYSSLSCSRNGSKYLIIWGQIPNPFSHSQLNCNWLILLGLDSFLWHRLKIMYSFSQKKESKPPLWESPLSLGIVPKIHQDFAVLCQYLWIMGTWKRVRGAIRELKGEGDPRTLLHSH